jgi:aryl-alcohol dehydrogenase-like predicted oxidoreductase
VQATLDLAYANEVMVIDTAPAYGGSEAVIGECLSGRTAFRVVTKTVPLRSTSVASSDIARLEAAFATSLERLKKQSVYAVLVHNADDLLVPGAHRLLDLLAQWRRQGRVQKFGVSVYDRQQIRALFESQHFDIVQLPVSVFDQRLVGDGTLEFLKSNGVEIHARSALLQGFAVMQPECLPPPLQTARPLLERFQRSMAEARMSPVTGALRYVAGLAAVDTVIVGVHSAAQLQECISGMRAETAVCDYSSFACDDEMIIDPRRWKLA